MATSNTSPKNRLRIDPAGNEAQRAFVEDTNRETAYIGGVGSGKTVAGIMRLARHIFEWNEGEMLAVVSPTVPMLRNVILPEMREWGLLGREEIEYRSSENTIKYPNGTTVILESANNSRKIERLRGLNLAAAWLDEVAEHQEKTYKILGDRLRTGDYRNLFATGTPKGYNWVHDEFADIEPTHEEPVADGRLIRNDHTTSIIGVSTEANPANPEDYIQSRKRQHEGASFRQEVKGEFTAFEGLVYPWFDRESHVVTEVPRPFDRVIYGVDWGFDNPSVILAIIQRGETYVVADEFAESRVTDDDLADVAAELYDEYGQGPIYCDPSAPGSIETFQRHGLNAVGAENDVSPGIKRVTAEREHLRVHERCDELIREFGLYRYPDDDRATDKPVKANDHALDALRYCRYTDYTDDDDDGFLISP